MRIENVQIFTKENKFVPGTVVVEGNKISNVLYGNTLGGKNKPVNSLLAQEAKKDAQYYLIPGMIDMHFHGCIGFDFSDGTIEAMERIAEYELSIGVTSICPATMTLPIPELKKVLQTAADFKSKQETACERTSRQARLVGINMEGPFISEKKCGAQDPKHILLPDASLFEQFRDWSDGLVKVMGLAPEKEGSLAFIEKVKEEAVVSIAHSNANYKEAKEAIERGASHAVHLFNGMSAWGHRDPGIVGAVLDDENVTAELICDTLHLHPATVRSAARLLGEDRTILISDSMRGTGLGDGRYLLGGLEVDVRGNEARLVQDGALAGSVTSLPECFKAAVLQMNVPLETAVCAVTRNPARVLGMDQEYGVIEKGYRADLVLLDQNLNVCRIWKDGQEICR